MPRAASHAVLAPRLRILQRGRPYFGPGKAELMAYIAATGSIRTAAREIGMSYPRAWGLVREMNTLFTGPLVVRVRGGGTGGGAELTPLGEQVLRLYSRIEATCHRATARDWARLRALLR